MCTHTMPRFCAQIPFWCEFTSSCPGFTTCGESAVQRFQLPFWRDRILIKKNLRISVLLRQLLRKNTQMKNVNEP